MEIELWQRQKRALTKLINLDRNNNMLKYRLNIIVIGLISLLLCNCAGFAPKIDIPKTPPPATKLKHRPRVALVLGSGGARGYAHIGVLQVLHAAHIPVDLIVGASSGSLVGAFYADSQNPQQVYQTLIHAGFFDFADISNIPNMRGIIKGHHLEKFILAHTHARRFKQLPIKLVVATTDLSNGQTYVIQSGPIAPAILASTALPGAIIPPTLYGHTLIDGGVVDPVPVDIAKRFHPKIIIAVNISKHLPKDLPYSAAGIYNRAYDFMWRRLTRLSTDGATLVIHPKVGTVGTFDLDDKYQMYLAGYKAAKRALPKILKILKQKHIKLESFTDHHRKNS